MIEGMRLAMIEGSPCPNNRLLGHLPANLCACVGPVFRSGLGVDVWLRDTQVADSRVLDRKDPAFVAVVKGPATAFKSFNTWRWWDGVV